MRNLKNLILVRHADYDGQSSDPGLSSYGKRQSLDLAQAIKKEIGREDIIIWSSSANRARETAEIIKQEMPFATMVVEEKLWSDNDHHEDFEWLHSKLKEFDGTNLVIVSHLEYVRQFPILLGYPGNSAGYASGVLIKNGRCENFS